MINLDILKTCRASVLMMAALVSAAVLLPMGTSAQTSETYRVAVEEIDDFKSVFARVESRDRVEARVRTGELSPS